MPQARLKREPRAAGTMQKAHAAAAVLLILAIMSSASAYVPQGKSEAAVRSDIPYIRCVPSTQMPRSCHCLRAKAPVFACT